MCSMMLTFGLLGSHGARQRRAAVIPLAIAGGASTLGLLGLIVGVDRPATLADRFESPALSSGSSATRTVETVGLPLGLSIFATLGCFIANLPGVARQNLGRAVRC
jgi:hypothetical protein